MDVFIAILILTFVIVAIFSSDSNAEKRDIANEYTPIDIDYDYIKSKLANEIATKIVAGTSKKDALVELWYDYNKATHNRHDASDIVKMMPEEVRNKIGARFAERDKRVIAVATMCAQTLEAILKIEYPDVDMQSLKKACQNKINTQKNNNISNNKHKTSEQNHNTNKISIQTIKLSDIEAN